MVALLFQAPLENKRRQNKHDIICTCIHNDVNSSFSVKQRYWPILLLTSDNVVEH